MRVRAQIAAVTATCFFLAAVVPAGIASADEKTDAAKQFFDAGKRFYEIGNWRAAIGQFKQASQILPSPILDYNIAICYEKLGKPKAALKYYRNYLLGSPTADNRAAVEAKIATLEAQIAATPAPPPPQPGVPAPGPAPAPGAEVAEEPAPPPPPPPPPGGYYQYGQQGAAQAPPVVPPEPAPRPVWATWWFWTLIGVGVILIIAVAASTQESHTTNTWDAAASPLLRSSKRGLGERPLLLQPPQPAGVLFRF
jgi:hypothetical protein